MLAHFFSTLFLACLLACGCARNPISGEKEFAFISETQEREIGKSNYNTMVQAQGGPFTADPELVAYVQSVGNKLALESHRSHLAFEFVIINDSVPNAWALPGGKIAINRGLLTELTSEAELAAVLGHEIVHAAARHGAKGLERGILMQGGIIALGVAAKDKKYSDVLVMGSSVGALLIQQKYSRSHELEADRVGIEYMVKAGYDPHAAVDLQKTFLRLSDGKTGGWHEALFASHPPSQERIEENVKTVSKVAPGTFFVGKDEYQAKIAYLVDHKECYEALDAAKKEKNHKKAKQIIDKALSSYPKESLLWNTRGDILTKQNKLFDAHLSYSKAIEYNKSYYLPYLNRGKLSAQAGNSTAARKDVATSLALLPTGAGHELMGYLFLQEQNCDEAIHHLEIASHADSSAGARARKMLSKLAK